MNFVRLWREPTLGFTFEGGFAPRWFVHLGRVRASSQIQIQIRLQLRLHFAPRFALTGELLFSVAKKVTKNALYRRQLFEVPVGAGRGLGVWHRALFRDLLARSSSASQGAYDDRARRSPAKAAIKHLTTIPINTQRSPLPPVKSAFAYFCRD